MKKLLTTLIFLSVMFGAGVVEARSGCCSHHGGVQSSGCGCNDGTSLSATCSPYYSCTSYKSSSRETESGDNNLLGWGLGLGFAGWIVYTINKGQK